MTRNIKLICELIQNVESEIKKTDDYYNRIGLTVPPEILEKYYDILHNAYLALEDELAYRMNEYNVIISPLFFHVAKGDAN